MPSNLQKLSNQQLSLALQWLTNAEHHPPEELQHLSVGEWMLLEGLLNSLMLERQHSQLH